MSRVDEFAGKGFRVLGIAEATHQGTGFPPTQDNFDWKFMGLVALYDPPKQNAKEVLEKIREAGIDVKLLTGDFSKTAMNIASQVGIATQTDYLDGDQVFIFNDDFDAVTDHFGFWFGKLF